VLKRRKLKRGNPEDRRNEKSFRTVRDGVVLGNTLESRQAHERIGGSSEPLDRWAEEQNLKLLRKGDRGMSVKPIGWSPQVIEYFGEQRSFRG
jgi:hypothetical protein